MQLPVTEKRLSTLKSCPCSGCSSEVKGRWSMAALAVEGKATTALRAVLRRVEGAAKRSGRRSEDVRVVAVGKTKPISLIRDLYDAGHRCFGENYVQEFIQKAPQIASHLDRTVANLGRKPLEVLVQVNTSGEESKYGVEPSDCVALAKHVKLNCPNLVFSGLMTIGRLDYTSTPENFQVLSCCKDEVCKELGIPEGQCELSMGMSGDFEQAIEMGSTNVRIGSTIFGPREYPKKENQ